MNRRPGTGFASSPVMVGAVTVLITVVAVFLAYNANKGLPFVPTYRLDAAVPNAANLVDGNDVRIAGLRVGVVESIEPVTSEDGESTAILHLKLDEEIEPLPEDSTLTVRNQSTIGLKYLQLNLGDSAEGFEQGAEIPIGRAKPEPVDLDQLFNAFDAPTRRASQINLSGFGNALAGRGGQLNGGIAELRQLVQTAQPVVANLADPSTEFGNFWRSLSQLSALVAPVAQQQAELFVGMDATFGAFARVARPYLQDTISKSAPAEDAAIDAFPTMRPFLDHSATFFTELQPGVDSLANGADDLAVAFREGIPALKRSPAFTAELVPTSQAVLDFQNTPGVLPGLDLLAQTNSLLEPPLSFIAPSQTVCNYLALLFGNVASLGRDGDGIGKWSRVIAFTPPSGQNNEGGPAAAPANGPSEPTDIFPGRQGGNHLHYNPYPNTAAPGQTRECEAGNEPYAVGQTVIGDPPGNQGTSTADQTDKMKKKKSKKKGRNK